MKTAKPHNCRYCEEMSITNPATGLAVIRQYRDYSERWEIRRTYLCDQHAQTDENTQFVRWAAICEQRGAGQ